MCDFYRLCPVALTLLNQLALLHSLQFTQQCGIGTAGCTPRSLLRESLQRRLLGAS